MAVGIVGATAQSFEKISSETLTAASSAFTAVTIPTGYKQLQVIVSCQVDVAGTILTRFNADAGNNYHYQVLDATGAAVSSGSTAGTSAMCLGQADSINIPTNANALIGNDGATAHPVQSQSGQGAFVRLTGGYWNNAAEISQVSVFITAPRQFKIGSNLLILGTRY